MRSTILSLLLALFLVHSCNTPREKNSQDASPTELGKELKSAEKGSVQRILFLGDSLTEGYGVAKEYAYPSLIQTKIDKGNYDFEVINASISGSTSASALSRLKWQLKSRPQVLFLALGANDGLRGIEPKVTEENLAQAITLAQQNEIAVILVGMKLPLNYGPKYRKAFEDTFEKLAKKYNCDYLPFLLKDVGGRPKYNISDGIHPNEKGHEIMAETVWPYLKKVITEMKSS